MGKIILITGGARSGKSSFAEKLLNGRDDVIYVATAAALDDEMKDRIAKHRQSRNQKWLTVEAYKNLPAALNDHVAGMQYILLDCVTIMVSSLMLENNLDWDNTGADVINRIENDIKNEVEKFLGFLKNYNGTSLLVTNELGMGIVPGVPMARYYRDIAGRMNQMIAALADEVYFIVSGIPMKIK